jgi:hypothetical protein
LTKYRKALVAASGVLIVVGRAIADASISASEAADIILALGVALGVYRVPNEV